MSALRAEDLADERGVLGDLVPVLPPHPDHNDVDRLDVLEGEPESCAGTCALLTARDAGYGTGTVFSAA